MTAPTLTRPVHALPGPRDGALVAPHHDLRPCVTNPPQWWDTDNPNNHKAIALCENVCPFKTTCKPEPGEVGLIRAGIPYDDRGKALTHRVRLSHHHDQLITMRGQGMTYPQIADVIGAKTAAVQSYLERVTHRVADRHERIAEMVGQGRGWAEIAEDIHARPEAVRAYWARHLARVAREAGRKLTRLPGVTDASRNRPGDYHDVIVEMLTAPGRPYSHAQVAYVIGSTRDAVRCYWARSCKEHHGVRQVAA